MSLASLVLYLALATLLFWFLHGGNLFEAFESDYSFVMQLLYGTGAGIASAGVIAFFSSVPPVKNALNDFQFFAYFPAQSLAGPIGSRSPVLPAWEKSFFFAALFNR